MLRWRDLSPGDILYNKHLTEPVFYLIIGISGDDNHRMLSTYIVNERDGVTPRFSGSYSVNNDDEDLDRTYERISPC